MLLDDSHLSLVLLWTCCCCFMQYTDAQIASTEPTCDGDAAETNGWLLQDYALDTVPSRGILEFRLPVALQGAGRNTSARGIDSSGSLADRRRRGAAAAVCTRLRVYTPRHASKITLAQLALPLRQCEDIDPSESGEGCADFVEFNGESRQCCIMGSSREGRVQAFDSVSAVLRTTAEVAQMAPVVRLHYEVIGCPMHALEAAPQRQRVVKYSWKTAPFIYCSAGLYELSPKDGAFLSSVEVPCAYESNAWSFIPKCRNVSSQEASAVMKAEVGRNIQSSSTLDLLLGTSLPPSSIAVLSPTAVSSTRYSSRGTALGAGSRRMLSNCCSAVFHALVVVYFVT